MSDSDIALARRAIALLDLTDLTDDASPAGVARLCERGGRARDGSRVRLARFRPPVGRRPERYARAGRDRGELPVRRRSPVCRARAHGAGAHRRGRRDRRRVAISGPGWPATSNVPPT